MSFTSSDDPTHPGIGGAEPIAHRRDVLYRMLASNATPVVQFPTTLRSAASLWAGVREWTKTLRATEVVAGDTVACALDFDDTLLQLLVACLWDDLSLVLLDPRSGDDALTAQAEALDVQLLVTGADRGTGQPTVPWWSRATTGGWPAPAHPLVQRRSPGAGARARRFPVLWCAEDDRIPLRELLPMATQAADRLALRAGCVATWGPIRSSRAVATGVLAPLLQADELFVAASLQAGAASAPDEPYTHLLVESAAVREARDRWPHATVCTLDGTD